jgi:8-oxo-dGTP diphosphatase
MNAEGAPRRSSDADDSQWVSIAVVEHCGRYLIGRRGRGASLAGMWEFPGGKVKSGEDPREAARRECREETGLEVVVGEPYAEVIHQYEHGRLRLWFFACTPCDPESTPKPPFRWVPLAELAGLQFPAANATLIARLTGGAY